MSRAQVAEGGSANRVRGEATLCIGGRDHLAEEELGPLFDLVERAGEGKLRLAEIVALFWHCLADRERIGRKEVGEAVMAQGLAASAKPLRVLLGEILKGSG